MGKSYKVRLKDRRGQEERSARPESLHCGAMEITCYGLNMLCQLLFRRWRQNILTGRATEMEVASRAAARLTTANDPSAAYNRHPGLNASGSTSFDDWAFVNSDMFAEVDTIILQHRSRKQMACLNRRRKSLKDE